MSTHPNAMLILALTPDDLARKTYRAILSEAGIPADDENGSIKVGANSYDHHGVMESSYNEDYQLSLSEGSIYVFALITYGYGEKVSWDKAEKQKAELEEWARGVCERHHCRYEIFLSANYW